MARIFWRILLLCALAGPAAAAEVTLRAITSLPGPHAINAQFHALAKEVNAKGKGLVQIHYIGGPESVPVAEQLRALQRGVVDLYFGPASYFDGQVPETGALNASNRTASELRANGAIGLLNKAYNAKADAEYLGYFASGVSFYTYLKSEPRRLPSGAIALEGVKLRGAPIAREFYQALGATLVVIQAPEIYSALERGVVDGIGWTALGFADSGWEKLLKVRILPSYWQGDISMLGNLGSLRKLDPAARKVLMDAILAAEKATDDWGAGERQKQEAKMQAAGVRDLRLEGEEARKYYAAAYGSLWTALERRLPKAEVDSLRKAFFRE